MSVRNFNRTSFMVAPAGGFPFPPALAAVGDGELYCREVWMRSDGMMGYPQFILGTRPEDPAPPAAPSEAPARPLFNFNRHPGRAHLASLMPSSMVYTVPQVGAVPSHLAISGQGMVVAEAWERLNPGADFWRDIWRVVLDKYLKSKSSDANQQGTFGAADLPTSYQGYIDTNLESMFPQWESYALTIAQVDTIGYWYSAADYFRRWCMSGGAGLPSNQSLGPVHYAKAPMVTAPMTDVEEVRAKWYSHWTRELTQTTQAFRARCPAHKGYGRYDMVRGPNYYDYWGKTQAERQAVIENWVDENTRSDRAGPAIALLDRHSPSLYTFGTTLAKGVAAVASDPNADPQRRYSYEQRRMVLGTIMETVDRIAAFHNKPIAPYVWPRGGEVSTQVVADVIAARPRVGKIIMWGDYQNSSQDEAELLAGLAFWEPHLIAHGQRTLCIVEPDGPATVAGEGVPVRTRIIDEIERRLLAVTGIGQVHVLPLENLEQETAGDAALLEAGLAVAMVSVAHDDFEISDPSAGRSSTLEDVRFEFAVELGLPSPAAAGFTTAQEQAAMMYQRVQAALTSLEGDGFSEPGGEVIAQDLQPMGGGAAERDLGSQTNIAATGFVVRYRYQRGRYDVVA